MMVEMFVTMTVNCCCRWGGGADGYGRSNRGGISKVTAIR